MRSARMLLATAAATAAFSFATPGAAFAVPAGDHDDSSYSKEHDSDSGRDHDSGSDSDHDKGSGKDHDEDSGSDRDKDYGNKRGGGREHDGPRGGMHTGGGALAAVRGDDWGSDHDGSRFDPESYKDKGEKGDKGDKGDKDSGDKGSGGGHDKGGWGDDHEKPRGGMHTGGGALAAPGATAGGIAVLAVGAAGAYALRRKKAVQPAS
ncbi:hypothetical protein D9753_33560 [Streptomyces dangxiongensis]|uniref:LPXTG cell wall anchor domain-containing protein n=1 Tax=Streptomyces dangxiongensis TaxID=1442032 RepID=A0A3G2JKL7_9ACTN|nr:hypothetical protein [Streptomyces dangxiongensis]AYN42996.1 hypothetical protein D9753_33560 [Streptomyces dangxiongensis]